MSSDDVLPLEKKRRVYKCQENFVELSGIPTWRELSVMIDPRKVLKLFKVNEDLNEKISLFNGDITTLEIDAVVNSTNSRFVSSADSRTVDGSISRAAGVDFRDDAREMGGCPAGQAKLMNGYDLPARYVIQAVGPYGRKPDLLKSCYRQCFRLMKENGLRTIAFPCISTGKLGYPNEDAAHVALTCAREFLEDSNNAHEVDRIIFCLFMPADYIIYERLMHQYFPKE